MKTRIASIAVIAAILLSGLSLRAEEMPDYIKDAKVGEWVLYSLAGGQMQMRQTVVEVTKTAIILKSETSMNGKVMTSMNQTIKLDSKGLPQTPVTKNAKPVITKGKAKINGKTVDCTVVTVTVNANGQNVKSVTKFSNEIPVSGLISSSANGVATMKLIDFGTK